MNDYCWKWIELINAIEVLRIKGFSVGVLQLLFPLFRDAYLNRLISNDDYERLMIALDM